jgi:hypothetical protein
MPVSAITPSETLQVVHVDTRSAAVSARKESAIVQPDD